MGISIDDGACGAWQRVPDEVISRLDGVQGAAYEVPDEVTCALENGHPDNHMAVLQAWGNQEAWLVWATPTMVTAGGCRVDGLTCLLSAGHAGRHHVIMTDMVEDEGPYWCDSRADLELQRTPI